MPFGGGGWKNSPDGRNFWECFFGGVTSPRVCKHIVETWTWRGPRELRVVEDLL